MDNIDKLTFFKHEYCNSEMKSLKRGVFTFSSLTTNAQSFCI